MTNRYVPEPHSDVNDLDLAKARLRVAGIQAAPTELIRRHPWSSMLGTFAAAVAIAGIAGGRAKKVVHVDGEHAHDHEKAGRGFALPAGFLQGVMNLAIQLTQAYVTKHAMKQAAQADEEAERAVHDPYTPEGDRHAVG